MKKLIYFALLLFTITAAIGGIISLFPYEAASYSSLLGYKSLCTFNPASALFCFMLAGTSCYFRASLFKYESGSVKEKLTKHRRSLIPLALLFVVAIAFSIAFGIVDSRYDSATHATVQD